MVRSWALLDRDGRSIIELQATPEQVRDILRLTDRRIPKHAPHYVALAGDS